MSSSGMQNVLGHIYTKYTVHVLGHISRAWAHIVEVEGYRLLRSRDAVEVEGYRLLRSRVRAMLDGSLHPQVSFPWSLSGRQPAPSGVETRIP